MPKAWFENGRFYTKSGYGKLVWMGRYWISWGDFNSESGQIHRRYYDRRFLSWYNRRGRYIESMWREKRAEIMQHVIHYIGKEVNGEAGRKTYTSNIRAVEVKRYLDVKLIDSLASQLGLKDIISKEILVFVYAQILDRPGINKLEEWLSSTEMPKMLKIENISTAKLYEALSDFDEVNFKEIEDKIRNKLLPYENDTKSIIIDVTDTYFESKKVPGKPRKGK